MAKNDQTTHGPDVVIDFCGFLKIILRLVLNLLEKYYLYYMGWQWLCNVGVVVNILQKKCK